MLKNSFKLVGLLILLLLSFIYTDKVVSVSRNSDPVMKEIKEFKKKNDTLPTEPIIIEDEFILGYSGLVVNKKDSYKNMKNEHKFNKQKIVYENKLPNNTITKTYDYYIKKGNPNKKSVAVIFKVKKNDDITNLLNYLSHKDIKFNFFIDGAWLEENVEKSFELVNLKQEIYNLGYNETYNKTMINTTNNLIESITLKTSKFCLNDEKNDEEKKICSNKKMYTIKSTLLNPDMSILKKELDNGIIITYDLDSFNYSYLNLIVKTIESKGYKVESLENIIKE